MVAVKKLQSEWTDANHSMSNDSMQSGKFASMTIKPHDCALVSVFAENVRRKRQELGFSQEVLAERAGVHRTYIGMLERQEKNVTIYNIERVAGALGVEAWVLLQPAGGD
jgi:ribosome-binding protein aMBF1 (putative translation factor)